MADQASKTRLLCVEDDSINSFILNKVLGDIYELTIVEDGEACLELAENGHYDVILLDINLGRGKLDGREVLQKLREMEYYSKIPIFAITSYALPGDEEQFLKSGFDSYFSKPLDKQLLVKAINKHINDH